MSFLSNLAYATDIQEEKDYVSSGVSVPESGVYDAPIKYAYLSQAQSGAGAVNFEFDMNGITYRETMYVTNRNGQNFYVDKKDGSKKYLPAYLNADAIALFASGKPLSELKEQPKVINLYNFDQKKEVPTEVPMLTELLGKQVKLGLIKEKSFKQTKDASGNYVDTDEVRESAVINKVFSAKDGRTVNEVRAEQTEAEFITKWTEKWEGKVNDKTTKSSGAKPATPATNTPKKSGLFG